jgi:hypothetical protein
MHESQILLLKVCFFISKYIGKACGLQDYSKTTGIRMII